MECKLIIEMRHYPKLRKQGLTGGTHGRGGSLSHEKGSLMESVIFKVRDAHCFTSDEAVREAGQVYKVGNDYILCLTKVLVMIPATQ